MAGIADYKVNGVGADLLLAPTYGEYAIKSSDYAPFLDGTLYLPSNSTNYILRYANVSHGGFNSIWGQDLSPVVGKFRRNGADPPNFARKGCCPMTSKLGSLYGSYGNDTCKLYTTDKGFAGVLNDSCFWVGYDSNGIWVAKPGNYAQTLPGSKHSHVIIMDIVGGGGGGGGGGYNAPMIGNWVMAGGGGGEAGAMVSIVVDLARSGQLLCYRGTGGAGGAMGANGSAGNGADGTAATIYLQNQSTIVARAPGGYGGYGATAPTGSMTAGGVSRYHVLADLTIPVTNGAAYYQHGYSFGGKGRAGASGATSGYLGGTNGYAADPTCVFEDAYDGFGGGTAQTGSSSGLSAMRGGGGGGGSALGNGGGGRYSYVSGSYTYVGGGSAPGFGGGGGGGSCSKRSSDNNVSGNGGTAGGNGVVIFYYEKTS